MSTGTSQERFLIIGCGAIGGIVAAGLRAEGHDVTAVVTNARILTAVDAHGIRVVDGPVARVARVRAVPSIPAGEVFDYVILATQPPQVEEAAQSALGALATDGAMVCLPNGLCDQRISAIAGPDRVIGAVVGWGATSREPGVYEQTSSGGFTLGDLRGGGLAQRHERLGRALAPIGPVEFTRNLAGKRWSKLAINCCVSSLGTIGGARLGSLLRHRRARRLGLEIMSEVVAVAHLEGVQLEKVAGTLNLPTIVLTEEERRGERSFGLLLKHGVLLGVGARFRRMKSSMSSAIERGRPPAVDFLNGEIVSRARRHGLDVPVNAALQRAVWDIAEGREQAGIELVNRIYERTRA